MKEKVENAQRIEINRKYRNGRFIDIPTRYVANHLSEIKPLRTIKVTKAYSCYYVKNPFGHLWHAYSCEIDLEPGYYIIPESEHQRLKQEIKLLFKKGKYSVWLKNGISEFYINDNYCHSVKGEMTPEQFREQCDLAVSTFDFNYSEPE